ncbi:MAG: sensor histidine kinase [Desulfuromonadaceae bacterium]
MDDPKVQVRKLSEELSRASRELSQENVRHKDWEDKLKNSLRQQRELSAHLMTLREEERTTVSREIHEDLGQMLAALQLNVSLMALEYHDHELLVARTRVMEQLITSSIMTVQRISSDLRPVMLDLLGLADAIVWQAEEYRKSSGIPCKTILLLTEKKVERSVSTAVFRIFQDAMTNAIRHSGATRVQVSLVERNGGLTLSVRDDGRGISEKEKNDLLSLGLAGMRGRAEALGGKLKICGSPRFGTVLLARIPLAGRSN